MTAKIARLATNLAHNQTKKVFKQDSMRSLCHNHVNIAPIELSIFETQVSSDFMGCPRSTVEKAPRAMRAMRGNGLENVPSQLYFGCTESFLKALSSQSFQETRPVRAEQVATVPLQPYFMFH